GAAVGPRFLDDERDRIDAEPGNAEPQPVADDAVDLLAHARVVHVQVGLEVVETVEVPGPRLLLVRPGRGLDAREDDPRADRAWALSRPDVPVAVVRVGG